MNQSLEKVIWHELGHFTICKLSNTKVLKFELNSKENNWFGSVDFDDKIKNDEVFKIQNLNFFLWRMINFFSGTIFEIIYLNKIQFNNYNTFNYFKNNNSGNENADFNKHLFYLSEFKKENNLYLKGTTDSLFKEMSKIILENSEHLKFYQDIVGDIIIDLNTNRTSSRTYSMNNKLIESIENKILISLENKSNPLNLILNLIEDYSHIITQKMVN